MRESLESLSVSNRSSCIPLPKRRWVTRLAIPSAVLVLTLCVLALASWESLVPARPVRICQVVVTEKAPAEAGGGDRKPSPGQAASIAVQAPGWVEPAPHPIYVPALADGVVDELIVLEGDTVKKGQVVARLVADDARLAVAQAEAALERRRAELAAAETDWAQPVELDRAAAVAKAQLEEALAEQKRLAAVAERDEALLAEAELVHESLRPLTGEIVPEVDVQRAMHEKRAKRAEVVATRRKIEVLSARIARSRAELGAAERNLELRVDLKRELEEARAAVAEAETTLAEAQLRLERMAVKSPTAGTVMNRLVAPGSKVMQGMDGPYSAHIVHLYNPESLQVRADVPLADAARIGVGQPVQVVVDVLPDVSFSGTVTRFVHQADISKNTLQVKVAIDNPSNHLKPDMLARVKFLAVQASEGENGEDGGGSIRLYAHRDDVLGDGQEGTVWVLSPDFSRAYRKQVALGRTRSDWVEVLDGLHPGDSLVCTPGHELGDEVRIRIIEEAAQ